MIAELTRLVKERMAVTPEDELIPICQGDGFTPSYDPGDRALVDQYGSESAPLIYCLNRVLQETKLEYPNHCIVTFSYQGTNEAPINDSTGEKLIPDSNLYIEYVRMGDAMHNVTSGIFNPTYLVPEFLEWRSLTPNMRIYSWSIGFACHSSPFPNYKAMAEDVKWFAPYVTGFGHQGTYYEASDWGELRDWTTAHLQWNVNLDVDALEQEFLDRFYGADAAVPLWNYLQRVQQNAANSSKRFQRGMGQRSGLREAGIVSTGGNRPGSHRFLQRADRRRSVRR